MKIILVEDETDLLEMMTEICLDLGYQAVGFTHPTEALRYLEQNKIDDCVVVSDYHLPNMNGHEMMRQMRAKATDMPFIFWSGHWEHNLRMQLLSNRDVDVLDKPFDFRHFRHLILKIAGTKEILAELQAAG